MTLKQTVTDGLKQAMKDRDADRLPTLRLINAAIKDKEIAMRNCEEGVAACISDEEIRAILIKMVKQRRESERAYEEGGRLELAERERAEAEIIGSYLPKPLSDEDRKAAISAAITDSGAESIRDMGAVMGLLKKRHSGRMDFAVVGAEVRTRLAS